MWVKRKSEIPVRPKGPNDLILNQVEPPSFARLSSNAARQVGTRNLHPIVRPIMVRNRPKQNIGHIPNRTQLALVFLACLKTEERLHEKTGH
jgi:hypothetical protein